MATFEGTYPEARSASHITSTFAVAQLNVKLDFGVGVIMSLFYLRLQFPHKIRYHRNNIFQSSEQWQTRAAHIYM